MRKKKVARMQYLQYNCTPSRKSPDDDFCIHIALIAVSGGGVLSVLL